MLRIEGREHTRVIVGASIQCFMLLNALERSEYSIEAGVRGQGFLCSTDQALCFLGSKVLQTMIRKMHLKIETELDVLSGDSQKILLDLVPMLRLRYFKMSRPCSVGST